MDKDQADAAETRVRIKDANKATESACGPTSESRPLPIEPPESHARKPKTTASKSPAAPAQAALDSGERSVFAIHQPVTTAATKGNTSTTAAATGGVPFVGTAATSGKTGKAEV